jgi:hypothetical protein
VANPSDRERWAAVVSAERELARCRADFYQHAQARAEVLSAALKGGAWDVGAALDFLRVLPDDTLTLLPQLVGHALSHRWALYARQAIGAAQARRDRLHPALQEIIVPRLDAADDDECRRFAELLAHVEAWDVLRLLTQRALASDDPDTREVGEDFIEWYGPMWGARAK